eukprot:8356193-Alexandrium_andersonii.AAC.1
MVDAHFKLSNINFKHGLTESDLATILRDLGGFTIGQLLPSRAWDNANLSRFQETWRSSPWARV